MTDESSQPKVKSFVHRIPNPVGRPYKIKSSQELWDKFVAYCDDVENDPWQQKTGSNSIAGGSGKSTNSMRQEVRVFRRAYTLSDFVLSVASFRNGRISREVILRDQALSR